MSEKKQQRVWQIARDEFDGEQAYRAACQEAMLEAEGILHRLGGVLQTAALREELSPGFFVPSGVMFRWESFVPAKRLSNGQVPVEEPVA